MCNVKKIVIEQVEALIGNSIIDEEMLHQSISALGMDSIMFIQMIVMLEDIFGFEFEDEMLSKDELGTLHNVIEYINRRVAQ